jgi:hypothetical protein
MPELPPSRFTIPNRVPRFAFGPGAYISAAGSLVASGPLVNVGAHILMSAGGPSASLPLCSTDVGFNHTNGHPSARPPVIIVRMRKRNPPIREQRWVALRKPTLRAFCAPAASVWVVMPASNHLHEKTDPFCSPAFPIGKVGILSRLDGRWHCPANTNKAGCRWRTNSEASEN